MKKIVLLFLLLLPHIVFSQNRLIDSLKKELAQPALDRAQQAKLNLKIASRLNSMRNKKARVYAKNALDISESIDSTKLYYSALLEMANYTKNHGNSDSVLPTLKRVESYAEQSHNVKLLMRTYSGYSSFYMTTRQNEKALPFALKSVELAESNKEKFHAYMGMAFLYSNMRDFKKASEQAMLAYEPAVNLGDPKRETSLLTFLGSTHMRLRETEIAEDYLHQAIKLGRKTDNLREVIRAYNDLGSIAMNTQQDTLKAISFFEEGLKIANQVGDNRLKNYSTMMLGRIYVDYGKEKEGMSLLKNAYRDAMAIDNLDYAAQIAMTIARHYEETLQKPDSALHWNKQFNALKDSITNLKKIEKFKIIETEYDVAKKDEQNEELQTELEAKRKEQIRLLVVGAVILLVVLLIGYLIFKNAKRKQQLLEKERDLEKKETDRKLKEQELATIDAIIQGQEKERERIAADLHDNIGANLAAAKLQFKHLSQNRDSEENYDALFARTEQLLDETYEEVRALAHRKNSGVFATKGLLPAVQKLTTNSSFSSNLKVELTEFGLNERLDNAFEITIFRILQELVTNIIKHAEASEANISITKHDNYINIIVEDNGKGFNTSEIVRASEETDGMGLLSVKKRVQHLNGTFELESHQGRGTQIYIDIPLQQAV